MTRDMGYGEASRRPPDLIADDIQSVDLTGEIKSVTDSAEYKAMQPNSTYAVLTANMVYDPKSKFAGVASPMARPAPTA